MQNDSAAHFSVPDDYQGPSRATLNSQRFQRAEKAFPGSQAGFYLLDFSGVHHPHGLCAARIMLRSGPGQFHIPAAAGNMAERPGAVHPQGGVFGAGIPEYGGGVNHTASLQRAAFRPRFTLVQKHGKFLLPVEGGQIFQNARRRYRHGKNCKGSTDGGQSFSSRFHRKTSEKMYFLFKGFQKLRQIRKDKLLNHQPFFLHERDIFYRNLTGAKQE